MKLKIRRGHSDETSTMNRREVLDGVNRAAAKDIVTITLRTITARIADTPGTCTKALARML